MYDPLFVRRGQVLCFTCTGTFYYILQRVGLHIECVNLRNSWVFFLLKDKSMCKYSFVSVLNSYQSNELGSRNTSDT